MIEISRTPYAFGTSHRLDEVEVERPDGSRLMLLHKHMHWSDLGSNAQKAKPDFLHNPMREIEAYRMLDDRELGVPKCYGSTADWLLIEKIPGVELWQIGDLAPWVEAARWLARLHRLFLGHVGSGSALLRYDETYFTIWPTRAAMRHTEIRHIVQKYHVVSDVLVQQPVTFIHGEFYPSNVLIDGDRVAPVDWEMAGFGPGVLDLAALVSGWAGPDAAEIMSGYGPVPVAALQAARLHLAMQWLGWSEDWTPPPEHRRDWVAEAITAAEQLGI